jgi:class 3 adenylate cyclase/tetratricopeptide (TPR) repeat protein
VPKTKVQRSGSAAAVASDASTVRLVTILIADLSGSTPLGERLDPEELRAILGAYFRRLTAEIHHFGGAIDKYVGDAVRAVFHEDGSEPSAVRALNAGVAMLAAIATENEDLERRYQARLSVRIGINTGPVAEGAPGQETLAALGRTVSVAQRLESTATPNSVHAGDGTYRAARGAFRFEGAPLITVTGPADLERTYRVVGRRSALAPVSEHTVKTNVHTQTTSASLQIGDEQAHLLEEQRKVVTVLFADVASLVAQDVAPERLRGVLGVYFSAVAAEIRRYGGTIDKYIGDAVMAVFGAPLSHEDDAARAIHAALGIQAAMRRENEALEKHQGVRLAVRIGVNTGEVVAGLLPGEVLAYTVTGDAVNTAQRIESVTPADDVFVSEQTRSLARKSFVFEAVGPLTLKGKSEPIPAYRVRRPLEVGDVAGPQLVGRVNELAQLAALFREVEAGRGVVAHIHGEPGVGKSRLLAEFLGTLPSPVRRISARCSSYETATPYAGLADLLRRWISVQTSDDAETARRALERALKPLALRSHQSAVALVLEILGYGGHSVLDPESKRHQLVLLLRRLLRDRTSAGSLVLTIEDIHWIDAASASLLADVFARLGQLRCLALTTSRDETSGSWKAIRIAIGPLDSDVAADMIDRVAATPLDEATRSLILERTGGNPFFIEEVVRSLGSRRAGAVPVTVQELLEAKVDALDAGPRRVAQHAAVIGRTFWTRVLARVASGEPMRPALATLEAERFVTPYELTPEEKYAFRHALVQEVVYQTQLMSQRRTAHTAVGAAIVELFGSRLDEFTDILAYHYGRSDDAGNARRFLLLAGQRAQRLYANAEALAYFEGALARSEDDRASRAAAYEGIGSVQRFEGKLGAAVASFELGIAALGDEDRIARSRLRVKIAAVLRLRGERGRALEMLLTELVAMPEDADAERAGVLLEIAETHWQQGNFDSASEALQDAVARAGKASATESLAEAYKHLGTVEVLRANIAEGLRWYERSLELFETLGDALAQGRVLNNMGIGYRRQARYPLALDAYTRGLAIKERLGDPLGIGAAKNNIAQVHRLLGDLDQAEAEYRDALDHFELIGVATGIAVAHSGLGSNALDRGDHKGAREHFLLELAESERIGRRASLAEPQRNIALTYIAEDRAVALEWAERAFASAQASGVPSQLALALQTLGIVRTARGEVTDAVGTLERSRDLLRDGDRHEFARTLWALGQAYTALPAEDQRRNETGPLVAEARAIFAELGAALDLRRLDSSGAAA